MNTLKYLFPAIILAACSSHELPPPSQKESALVAGPWATLPKNCQIHGRTQDFTLTTSGHVESGAIYIYLTFKTPQSAPPAVTITGLSIPLAVEGKSPTFNFKMPFNQTIAAHLQEPATYFNVRYYNVGATQAYESSLPTPGFIDALNFLGPTCD